MTDDNDNNAIAPSLLYLTAEDWTENPTPLLKMSSAGEENDGGGKPPPEETGKVMDGAESSDGGDDDAPLANRKRPAESNASTGDKEDSSPARKKSGSSQKQQQQWPKMLPGAAEYAVPAWKAAQEASGNPPPGISPAKVDEVMLEQRAATEEQEVVAKAQQEKWEHASKSQGEQVAILKIENGKLRATVKKLKAKLEASQREVASLKKGKKDAAKVEARMNQKIKKQSQQMKEDREKMKQVKKEVKALKRGGHVSLRHQSGDEPAELSGWDRRWNEKYETLKRFKAEHGHCNCGRHIEGLEESYPKLRTWVQSQRTDFRRLKQGKSTAITPYRIKMLNDIGFDWQPNGQDWIGFSERIPQLSGELYETVYALSGPPFHFILNFSSMQMHSLQRGAW